MEAADPGRAGPAGPAAVRPSPSGGEEHGAATLQLCASSGNKELDTAGGGGGEGVRPRGGRERGGLHGADGCRRGGGVPPRREAAQVRTGQGAGQTLRQGDQEVPAATRARPRHRQVPQAPRRRRRLDLMVSAGSDQ